MSEDPLAPVERLLDEVISGAESGLGSSDETNADAREAVRLLLDATCALIDGADQTHLVYAAQYAPIRRLLAFAARLEGESNA